MSALAFSHKTKGVQDLQPHLDVRTLSAILAALKRGEILASRVAKIKRGKFQALSIFIACQMDSKVLLDLLGTCDSVVHKREPWLTFQIYDFVDNKSPSQRSL